MADEAPKTSYVIDPSGEAVKVYGDEGEKYAAATGQKQVSGEVARALSAQRQLREDMERRYSPIERAGMGAFSGATLGIGPAASAKLAGLIDPEAEAMAKRDLAAMEGTGAFLGGEVAGTLLPAAFGAGPLEFGGSMAERLAARLLPEATGVLGKAAGGAVQMAARGSAEGALMNLGHTTGSSIIYNRPLTAEALAASGAEGALFGGLFGGAIGAAGGAIGAGVDAAAGGVGRLARTAGAQGVTRGEAIAARSLGAKAEDIIAMGSKTDEGIRPAMNKFREIIEEQAPGKGFNLPTGRINEIARDAVVDAKATQAALTRTLDREAPGFVPNYGRTIQRMELEVYQPMAATIDGSRVGGILAGLERDLSAVTSAGEGGVWKAWIDSREQLASRIAGEGLGADIRSRVLNVIDDEIRSAMEFAGQSIGKKGLAESFAAAKTTQLAAEQLERMTGAKVASSVAEARGALNPMDLGMAAGAFSYGHPVAAVMTLGGKFMSRMAEGALEPAVAEFAYKLATGSKAGAAAGALQDNIQGAVKGFFGATKAAAMKANAKAFNGPKNRDEFDARLERAHELMSPQHQARVNDFANQVAQSGQEALAQQIVELNTRAVTYLRANAPPSKSAKKATSLGPLIKMKDLSKKDMDFINISNVITRPHAVLEKIRSGSVSQTEMRAMKAVWPEVHSGLVEEAQREVLAMKSEGKTLAADKIVGLGILLGAAVDPMLEKGYIDAVQASFVPPEQPQGQGPPAEPMVNVDDLKTPLQKAIS